ncbi:hypothetical protein SE15_05285 [Thermanaerothrix daxensis]|uniref:Uncharacterized protein n=1 Tax=Thermanaerothrix daxensis TaxID=869279 RepID=A0A0P6YNW9_9CHLR|nr:hypothetical protein [Thermanaerothrix daxensis]KPL84501.1 hypothetical protein SE15_05285 [Thermanaerothrix daxensis]
MRTPAGAECPFFYGNYYRGRNQEECRLISPAAPPNNWAPTLCRTCPVPRITQANACEHMVLRAWVERQWLGLRKRVRVSAFCQKVHQEVAHPEVGCGECHPIPFSISEHG